MTRKRTKHKLRKIARRRQSDWWGRVFDELFFMYGSGARGVNPKFLFPTGYTGFAGNSFSAPDTDHIQYGGGKVKATVTTSETMNLTEIDKFRTKAVMMDEVTGTAGTDGGTKNPAIQPIMVDGEEHHVCVMSPYQAYNVRVSTTGGQWLDLQKSLAAAIGTKSKIFKGGMGMHNNVVLHEHKSVIRFSDYGSGTNLPAARALFLGEQAMVCAFGSPGTGLRFGWHEETRDNGNQLIITSSTIVGVEKVTFNGKDYGVGAIDTYATQA